MNYDELMIYALATCLNQYSNREQLFFLWCNEEKDICKKAFKKSHSILEAIVLLKKEWQKEFPQFKTE